MIEEWKDIPGYEGLYQASSMGRIKSINYTGYCFGRLYSKKREKILKPCKNKNGKKYRLIVSLRKDKAVKRFYIHQLVIQTFVGPCPSNMEVCHNNGDSENNSVENLRYDTHKSNMIDMSKHGNSQIGIKNPNCKLTEEQVLTITSLLQGQYTIEEIAEQFGVANSLISCIKNKKYWKHLTENIKLDRKNVRKTQNKGSTKLTSNDIDTIKKLIHGGLKSKEIAKRFGVSFETINRIKKGITFKEAS